MNILKEKILIRNKKKNYFIFLKKFKKLKFKKKIKFEFKNFEKKIFYYKKNKKINWANVFSNSKSIIL